MSEVPSKKQCQVLWVFGALEKLQNLGFIEQFGYNFKDSGLEMYSLIDEHRGILFDDDEQFNTVVRLICANSDDPPGDTEICEITEMLRQFKDDRDPLVKFALSELIKQ
jgi:hypothetical protein